MTKNELTMLQALPLEVKIAKSHLRIREFVDHFGEENVYIAFSGGKDSTVLLHLVRSIYPNIKAVFSNTGLEFPELVQFVKKFDNVDVVRPEKTFVDVIRNYGYPMVSKKVAMMIQRIKSPADKNVYCRELFLNGTKKDGTKGSRSSVLPKKWRYLIDAPFDITDKCCKILKKDPLKNYEKKHKVIPIMGTMAVESDNRAVKYLKTGCNSFERGSAHSQPMGFWTEQDVLAYIKMFDLEIASVYGEIIENEDGKLETTGEKRTGCIFCGFGCHFEQGQNRYQRLEQTHPQLHSYCMNKLGFKEVLEYMDIPYTNEDTDKVV